MARAAPPVLLPHVAAAQAYAEQILAGEQPCCRWVELACRRHLTEIERSAGEPEFPFEFDPAAAEAVCQFVEIFPHTKGVWAARHEPFRLQPWQSFILVNLFGWKRRRDGLRRYRKALVMVSRKNGKSDLSARIGLYMLAGDGEAGAEIYSGATSEKQAWEVFRPALTMARQTPAFLEHFGVQAYKQSIAILENGSRFEPVIGKPGDGASPSCAIVDEYHEHDGDDLAQTMLTGMGAREQPLMLYISTAGANTAGPCYALMLEARRVLDGLVRDDELFALLYGLDEGDDWSDPELLRKANPNYDVSVSGDFLLARHRDAMQNAREQGIYQIKHLNRWVGARNAYFSLPKWLACQREIDRVALQGQQIYLGMDLASTVDVNALCVLARDPENPERLLTWSRFYLPEAAAERSDAQHFQAWAREGRLILTPGEIVDMERIRDDILQLARDYRIADLGFDPYQATMLVSGLIKEGIPCTEVRPTVLNFSQPMKHLDGLMRAGTLGHDGDPVMTWMVGNVTALHDAKDNVYPRKEARENKIDGVVALLSALARFLVLEEQGQSVYEQRGLLMVG